MSAKTESELWSYWMPVILMIIRAECIIQDCWEIITGTAPRPVQHPLPVVEEKGHKSGDSSSSSSSSSKGKQEDSDDNEEREEEQKKSVLSRLDSAKDWSGLGMLSPTGVILDDYAMPEEELIPLGGSVLDTTMIYMGTIQPNASQEERECHKRKIQKWIRKSLRLLESSSALFAPLSLVPLVLRLAHTKCTLLCIKGFVPGHKLMYLVC